MIWVLLYKIFRFLTGDKPIYNVIKAGDIEIIHKNIKLKETPIEGEVIYFKDGGPYYKIVRIAHHVDKFHTIWISVELINLEKK